MKLFVSWSGTRSRHLAEAVKEWLIFLFPTFDVWVSSEDIRAGERWFFEISQRLSQTDFGILCLTKENISSPWLLFEAGALSKSLDAGRVVPLLSDLEYSEVPAPLSLFQCVKADESGIRKLVQTLSALLPNNHRSDTAIERIFSLAWPEFGASLKRETSKDASATAEAKKLPVVRFSHTEGNIVEIDGTSVALSPREYEFYKFLAERCASGAASFPYYKAVFPAWEDYGQMSPYDGPDTFSAIVSSLRKKFDRAGLKDRLSELLPVKGRIGIKAKVLLEK